MSLVVVVHDLGSASPLEILGASRSLCDVLFVCDRSRPHVERTISGLSELAPIVDVTGQDIGATAGQIADLRPAAIVTFSEYQLRDTATIAATCGLRFYSPAVAEVLTDKFAQRSRLRQAGVDPTRSAAVRTPDEAHAAATAIGPPVVVKPRMGAGSVDTSMAATPAEAASLVRLFGPGKDFVVEEYLTGDRSYAGALWGDYVSVDSLVQSGAIGTVAVAGKLPLTEPFRETGMFTPASISGEIERDVVGLVTDALRALDVQHGVTHTEVKLTTAGPRLIEVNGRLGGNTADLLRRSARVDTVRMVIRAALGQEVEVDEPCYDKVAFQYFVLPGARPGGPAEHDRLRNIPGVRRVVDRNFTDRSPSWRDGTLGQLATIYGDAPDLNGLDKCVREIEACLDLRHPRRKIGTSGQGA